MLSTLALTVLLSASGQAAENVEQSVTVNPFRATWPALDARYEKKLGDNQGAYGRIAAGKYNPLALRALSFAMKQSGEELNVAGSLFGVGGGYNYYFKSFDRGWFGGMAAEVNRTSTTLEYQGASLAVTATDFSLGPVIGWKRVADSGLTFSWELGAGYNGIIGSPTVSGQVADQELSAAVDSEENTGFGLFGGMQLGYSF